MCKSTTMLHDISHPDIRYIIYNWRARHDRWFCCQIFLIDFFTFWIPYRFSNLKKNMDLYKWWTSFNLIKICFNILWIIIKKKLHQFAFTQKDTLSHCHWISSYQERERGGVLLTYFTILGLFKTGTWISICIIDGVFWVHWFEVRCGCVFCWYWWNC